MYFVSCFPYWERNRVKDLSNPENILKSKNLTEIKISVLKYDLSKSN